MRAYSILSNSGETIRDFTLGALKAGGGIVVQTYSVGLEATASTNFAKTSLEKKAIKK